MADYHYPRSVMPARTETAGALKCIELAVPSFKQSFFRQSYAAWIEAVPYAAAGVTLDVRRTGGTKATKSDPARMGYVLILEDLAPSPGVEVTLWLESELGDPECNRKAFLKGLEYLRETAGSSTMSVTVRPGANINAGEQSSIC